MVLILWFQEQTAGLKNTDYFFKYSADNDGKVLFCIYRAGTVHCLKRARRPCNVGETRDQGSKETPDVQPWPP